jgi:hypothetical protein
LCEVFRPIVKFSRADWQRGRSHFIARAFAHIRKCHQRMDPPPQNPRLKSSESHRRISSRALGLFTAASRHEPNPKPRSSLANPCPRRFSTGCPTRSTTHSPSHASPNPHICHNPSPTANPSSNLSKLPAHPHRAIPILAPDSARLPTFSEQISGDGGSDRSLRPSRHFLKVSSRNTTVGQFCKFFNASLSRRLFRNRCAISTDFSI